jgi:hypothetical protein
MSLLESADSGSEGRVMAACSPSPRKIGGTSALDPKGTITTVSYQVI